jgi:O-antigen/teichoic acid export membrane protein
MTKAKQPSYLVAATIRGTAWSSTQAALARVLAAVSTIVLARLLAVSEFGIAGQAASVGVSLALFTPGPLADVLVAQAAYGGLDVGAARRASRFVGWIGAGLIFLFALGWAIVWADSLMPWLLMVFCIRPLAEAASVVPLAILRVGLRFREIAMADMAAVLGASAVGVALALLGFGPFALAIPPAALLMIRAAGYLRCTGPVVSPMAIGVGSIAVPRAYWAAALSQYVHGLVVSVDVLMLAWWSSTSSSGLYVFSIALAMQAHSLFVLQLSSTLQPILVAMGDDMSRQFMATARAARCIAAVAVPAAICQSIVSENLIRLAFGAKWVPAWPIFSVTCGSMAMSAAAAPLLAYLKARGMFRFVLVWQSIHLIGLVVIGTSALWLTKSLDLSVWVRPLVTEEASPALAIATAVFVSWILSLSLAVRCCRPAANSPGAIAFVGVTRPLAVAAPVLVAGLLAREGLQRLIPFPYSDWAVVLLVAPCVFVTALLGNAAFDSGVRADLFAIFSGVRRRVCVR